MSRTKSKFDELLKTYKLQDYNTLEFINELKSNPLLKEYDINIYNCNMFAAYLADCSNCSLCKGLDECKNEIKGYSSKISFDNGYFLKKIPCKYKLLSNENNKRKSKFKTLYLPQNILEASFDDYKLSNVERKKCMQFSMGFVQSFNRKELTKGLYVCGNFQVGKTYYLAATANLCADNDIDCLLIYFPDLIRELKSSMGKSSFEEKINMLKQVDVLMLDDLGAEFASNWTRDEILCPILNYRLQERLPVFISSNYTLEGLRNFYKSLDDNSNNADRIIARIKALATYIEMPGK